MLTNIRIPLPLSTKFNFLSETSLKVDVQRVFSVIKSVIKQKKNLKKEQQNIIVEMYN